MISSHYFLFMKEMANNCSIVISVWLVWIFLHTSRSITLVSKWECLKLNYFNMNVSMSRRHSWSIVRSLKMKIIIALIQTTKPFEWEFSWKFWTNIFNDFNNWIAFLNSLEQNLDPNINHYIFVLSFIWDLILQRMLCKIN